MQPSSMDAGPVQEVSSVTSCLTNESEEQQQKQHFPQQYDQTAQQHIQPSMDDFMEQMFMMQPWDFNASSQPQNMNVNCQQKLFTMPLLPQQQEADNVGNLQFAYEDPAVLAARLRQHQLNGTVVSAPHSLPLSLGRGKPGDINGARPHEEIMANNARDPNLGGLFSPFAGTARGLLRPPVPAPSPGFQTKVQVQAYGGMPQPQHPNPSPPVTAGAAPSARPRVRARRGQATDPHSIAERLRRERIAERMKALQELVPNSNKTDKASMLDEIIEYVKFLQLQVKVLSMSRLGGAGAVAPLVADMPSEGANARSNGSQNSCADGLSLTEKQVAKLMEEDMGSAMQYLQGKGLCLMPISLATAISSTTRKQQQQQQPQSTQLQGLLASNGIMDNQRRQQQQQQQLVEPANSSLSAITTISSSTEAGNSLRTTTANNNGSSSCKDGRTANSVTNANGIKTDEESQSRRTGLGL